jgi:hypothetical protein
MIIDSNQFIQSGFGIIPDRTLFFNELESVLFQQPHQLIESHALLDYTALVNGCVKIAHSRGGSKGVIEMEKSRQEIKDTALPPACRGVLYFTGYLRPHV